MNVLFTMASAVSCASTVTAATSVAVMSDTSFPTTSTTAKVNCCYLLLFAVEINYPDEIKILILFVNDIQYTMRLSRSLFKSLVGSIRLWNGGPIIIMVDPRSGRSTDFFHFYHAVTGMNVLSVRS